MTIDEPTHQGTGFLDDDWFTSDDDPKDEGKESVQIQEAVFADIPGIPKDLIGKPVNEENLRLLGQKNTELMGEFTRAKQALNTLVQEKEGTPNESGADPQNAVDESMVDSIIELQLDRFSSTDVQAAAVLKRYRKEVEEALGKVQNPRHRVTKEMIKNAIFFVASQHFNEVMEDFKAGTKESSDSADSMPKPKPLTSLEPGRSPQKEPVTKTASAPNWWDKMDDRRKANLLKWYGSPEAAKKAIMGESL